MNVRHLNLAARPFVNNRPITRLTAVLWAAAVAFLVADALLFWGYWRGHQDQRAQLTQVEGEIGAERRTLGELGRKLAAVDVAQLNRRTELLNQKIAERTFGWGQLFDHLTALLPADVRLISLTPQSVAESRPGRRRGAAAAGVLSGGGGESDRVRLEILGAARRDEAVLELLDALFADPAFEDPNLARESKEQGEVRFSLSAVYLPAVVAARDSDSADAADAADSAAAGAEHATPEEDGAVGGGAAAPAPADPATAPPPGAPRRRS
jgi:Tfp pilus assembly protein PilN